MSQVHYRNQDGVAVLSIDNPPVNAASQAVRAGIVEELKRAAADAEAKVVVLIGSGKTFIAGADIREFNQPQQAPLFPEVLAALENSTRPVVAALHGTALGGGLEFSMACHYRVGLASVKLGLPEVNLGLLPGGAGTQNLPRLIGPTKALDTVRHYRATQVKLWTPAPLLVERAAAGGGWSAA
ncbi:MAG: enoyl-CoA hydratase-related protein [Panacagrimonas sp.]